MSAILAMAIKDLRLLARDRMDLFFTFLFPFFFAVFFGIIFAGGGDGPRGIAVAVADLDRSAASRAFIDRLRTGGGLKIEPVPDPASGEDLVRRGRVAASLAIPQGFADWIGQLMQGRSLELPGAVDPSRRAEAGVLEGIVMREAFSSLISAMQDPAVFGPAISDARRALAEDVRIAPAERLALGAMLASVDNVLGLMRARTDGAEDRTQHPAQPTPSSDQRDAAADSGETASRETASDAAETFTPVRLVLRDAARSRQGPTSAFAVSFTQGIVWGVMGCVTAFGIGLASERGGGTLVRLTLAPIGRWKILAGKALACFLTCVAVCVLMLAVAMMPPFHVRIGSPALAAAAVLCIAAGFVGVMMLLSVIARTVGAASGMGRAALLVLAMIGGGSIPVFLMPGWMQTASSISPFKWAVLALDGAIWRGFSPAEMLLPCGVLLAVGAAGFAIGARSFRWSAA